MNPESRLDSNAERFKHMQPTTTPPEFPGAHRLSDGRQKSAFRLLLESLEPGQWIPTGVFLPPALSLDASEEDRNARHNERTRIRARISAFGKSISLKKPSIHFVTRLSDTQEIWVGCVDGPSPQALRKYNK
jgi:hypothetical protein